MASTSPASSVPSAVFAGTAAVSVAGLCRLTFRLRSRGPSGQSSRPLCHCPCPVAVTRPAVRFRSAKASRAEDAGPDSLAVVPPSRARFKRASEPNRSGGRASTWSTGCRKTASRRLSTARPGPGSAALPGPLSVPLFALADGPAWASRLTSAAAQLSTDTAKGASSAPLRRARTCSFAPSPPAVSPASRSARKACAAGAGAGASAVFRSGVCAFAGSGVGGVAAPPSNSDGSRAFSTLSASRCTAGSQPGRSFKTRAASPSITRRPSTVRGGCETGGSGAGGRSGRRRNAGLTLRMDAIRTVPGRACQSQAKLFSGAVSQTPWASAASRPKEQAKGSGPERWVRRTCRPLSRRELSRAALTVSVSQAWPLSLRSTQATPPSAANSSTSKTANARRSQRVHLLGCLGRPLCPSCTAAEDCGVGLAGRSSFIRAIRKTALC